MFAAAGCGASQTTPGPVSSARPPSAPSRTANAVIDPLPTGWTPFSTAHGRAAVATQHTVSDGAAVELVRFDAPSTRLVLHPGYQDPGGSGWSTHSAVRADERPSLLAAFNGGFKLDAGAGGMAVGTRQAGQLVDGLATVGVQLPRTAAGQEAVSRPTSAPRPGDLVFFGVPGAAYHVAIYLGGGQMFDAPHTGAAVRVEPVWDGARYGQVLA